MIKPCIILFLVSSIVMLSACKTDIKPRYNINCEIIGANNGLVKLARLNLADNETEYVDSVMMLNEHFVFEGQISTPYNYTIILPENQGKIHFFLESSEIKIKAKIDNLDSVQVTGSREDSLFRPWYNYYMFEKKEDWDIMLNHPDYCFSAFVAYYHFQVYQTPIDSIQMVIDRFSDEVKQSEYYIYLLDLYEKIKLTDIGQKAPDFELPSQNGEMLRLSSFEGKYVLLDFWASWCAPCRVANRELLELYDSFKDKNFEIVAISIDEDKSAWLKAIEKDGSKWTHLSDLKGWNTETAKTYGVRAVPQNFLLDTNGIILRKNMSTVDLASLLEKVSY
ncbi:MAG: TlpA disulfide reductase family protein [Bacteroidota bacterium]